MLESEAIERVTGMGGMIARMGELLEEETVDCRHCLVAIKRDNETPEMFNDRVIEVAGTQRFLGYFVFSDHLQRRYRRLTAIILCEDHWSTYCDFDEMKAAHERKRDEVRDLEALLAPDPWAGVQAPPPTK